MAYRFVSLENENSSIEAYLRPHFAYTSPHVSEHASPNIPASYASDMTINLTPAQPGRNISTLSYSGEVTAPYASQSSPTEEITTVQTPSPSKNWNEEYQRALDMPCHTIDEQIARARELCRISHDFVAAATQYGQIIIAEAGLPADHKTIKPVRIGGVAGGEKYLHHGLLFKFAVDWAGLYGGVDAYAMKAASHELRALVLLTSATAALRTPLMALVDYRGFRLVCVALLPIHMFSLKYGSADAGMTVRTEEPFHSLMADVCAKLHLKAHIGKHPQLPANDEPLNPIYGPTDIEGHAGSDGRLYLVDVARLFPPESPRESPPPPCQRAAYLYRLLRPELVRNVDTPLSSDAYSPFGAHNAAEHNAEVDTATQKLLQECVPRFSEWLIAHVEEIKTDTADLTAHLHREGVNCRHLGKVLAALAQQERAEQTATERSQRIATARAIVVTEVLARSMKNRLFSRFRNQMALLRSFAEQPFVDTAVAFLNLVLAPVAATSDEVATFWDNELVEHIRDHFVDIDTLRTCVGSLHDSQSAPSFRLRKHVHSHASALLGRFQTLTGIVLSLRSVNALFADLVRDLEVELVPADVVGLSPRTKTTTVMAASEAELTFLTALRKTSPRSSGRMLEAALRKFEETVAHNSQDAGLVEAYGRALCESAKVLKSADVSKRAYEQLSAVKHFRALIDLANPLVATYHVPPAGVRFGRKVNNFEAGVEEQMQVALKCYEDANKYIFRQLDTSRQLDMLTKWASAHVLMARYLDCIQEVLRSYSHYVSAGALFQRALELAREVSANQSGVSPADEIWPCWILDTDSNDFSLAIFSELHHHSPELRVVRTGLASRMLNSVLELLLSHNGSNIMAFDVSCWNELTEGLSADTLKMVAAHCKSLRSLRVVSGWLTDDIFDAILTACSQLEDIDVRECSALSDGGLQRITTLQHLRVLSLDCVEKAHRWFASPETVAALRSGSLAHLEELSLSGISKVTDAELAAFFSECPPLVVLCADNTKFGNSSLVAIAGRSHRLCQLRLANTAVTDVGFLECLAKFETASQPFSSLEALDLSRTKVDSKAIDVVLSLCPRLCVLNLFSTSVEAAGIAKIATSPQAGSLRALHLGDTLVDDENLQLISQHCHALERLHLPICRKITDSGLAQVLNGCRQLVYLSIDSCLRLTAAIVDSISAAPALSQITLTSQTVQEHAIEELKTKCPWIRVFEWDDFANFFPP